MSYTSKDEAAKEAYLHFHKNIRPIFDDKGAWLPGENAHNDDVDAFRHAYTSGVFTQEFTEGIANILGHFNEIKGQLKDQPDSEKNMDLWNNKVGREYGKKTTSKQELAELLQKALENDELIITDDQEKDSRKYIDEGITDEKVIDPNKPITVIKESDTGRNLLFLNMLNGEIMTNDVFVNKINAGDYPGYHIARVDSIATPVSNADGSKDNNLG